MPPLTSLLELITTQSGALVYQLVTLFAIQLILGVAFGHWQRRRDGGSLRLLAMGMGIFLARAILMVAALLGRSGLLHSRSALPPLERCLDLVTVVLVAWAFVSLVERHPRSGTRGLVVAVLGATTIYVVFARLWPGAEAQGLAYNGYWQERVWEGLTSATLVLALVASIAWRGGDWGWLVCLLGLWLAGHGLQLIAPVTDADSAGWVRLANLAALPLLAALVYRRALGATSPVVVDSEEMTLGVVSMLKAIQRIEADAEADSALELAASAIARTVCADMVAIGLRVPESTDAVRVVALHPATSVTLANQETTLRVSRYPLLSTALQSRHLERAVAEPHVSRVTGLYRHLGFDATGPLLIQPLTVGDEVLGAVLAGNPISGREWRIPDEQILQALAAALASAIAGSQERRTFGDEALDEARREIQTQAEHARRVEADLEEQRQRAEELLAELRQRDEGVRQLEEAQAIAATAQEELAKSVEAHSALRTLLAHWQDEAQRLGEEKAELEDQLAQLPPTKPAGGQLIRATDVDLGQVELAPVAVDLAEVAQDVLHALSAQLEENALSVESDLEPDLPPVYVDRDSVQRALLNLVSNAALASKPATVVRLCARVEEPNSELAEPPGYALISITDTGGGITAEDQPRVFRRFSGEDRSPIAGLGESGAVLSAAGSLIEANGGRIWVESETGEGSTFNFILPLLPERDDQGAALGPQIGDSGE